MRLVTSEAMGNKRYAVSRFTTVTGLKSQCLSERADK